MQASLVAQWGESVCNAGRLQEIQVWSLGWEDPLEEVMTTLSRILAWRIPWTEKPGGLQSLGLQRIRHDFIIKQQQQHQNAPPLLHFTEIIFFHLPFTENMQEYWSGLPCSSPGDLSDPRIEPGVSCIAGSFFTI